MFFHDLKINIVLLSCSSDEQIFCGFNFLTDVRTRQSYFYCASVDDKVNIFLKVNIKIEMLIFVKVRKISFYSNGQFEHNF